ncbi:hypothetical protein ACFY00_04655 [Kitasatospora sp. NPDC001540]|uniref:hypothetical protein n=1 Tax=Kitasatospora sp. NPDC001540 TaxID=3364014 RepID=UPI003698877B
MDDHPGTAALEWWANDELCVGPHRLRISPCPADGGDLRYEAVLDPGLPAGAAREGFDLLLELDPHFTLRFPDGSSRPVSVARSADGGRLLLTAA